MSSCISSEGILCEAALDTLAEIAPIILWQGAQCCCEWREGQYETAGLTEPGLQRLTEIGLDFLAIIAAEFQFRAVVQRDQKVSV